MNDLVYQFDLAVSRYYTSLFGEVGQSKRSAVCAFNSDYDYLGE